MIKNGIRFGVREYTNNKKLIHQTGILFSSQTLVLAVGIPIKAIQTRALGPELFGLLAFWGTLTGFTVLFFRFGFFSSLQVLLARSLNEQEEREYIAAGFIIALMIGVLFSCFLFVLSFYIDPIFQIKLGHILRSASPLCFILPFNFFIPAIGTGTNKVEKIAKFTILTALFILLLLSILFVCSRLSIAVIITVNLCVAIGVSLFIIKQFKPIFKSTKARINEIWMKNKKYGLKIYLGQVVSQSTYKLDEIFISYFVNTIWVGYYSLIVILTSPMVKLSNALTDSLFKNFASRKTIPSKIFIYNAIWLIACAILLIFLGKYIIIFLFSERYLPSSKLIMPMAIASLFQGLYQPQIRFLTVHERGNFQRNAAILVSICNIVTNLMFVPTYGAFGAAIASVISRFIALITNHYYYYRTTHLLRLKNAE